MTQTDSVQGAVGEEDVAVAFDNLLKARQVIDSELSVLLAGANSSRNAVSIFAGALLGQLAVQISDFLPAIEKLCESPKLYGRLAALEAIRYVDDENLKRTVIALCIGDRSAKVRIHAADKALESDLPDLAPKLTRVIETESDNKTRISLECYRDLLADGYHVSPEDETGLIWVSVRLPHGTVEHFVTEDDFANGGPLRTAQRLAEEHGVVLKGQAKATNK